MTALIVGSGEVEQNSRDIVIHERGLGLRRIKEIHPKFMAMQYPLIFPYGEDGYTTDIMHRDAEKTTKKRRKFVTTREFYAYRFQERREAGNLIDGIAVLCGRLRLQFLVDAFTAIEETRLEFTGFIHHFSCNPKWPEIKEFLAFIPNQKPAKQPDVISRVFKIKRNELLEDIIKRSFFGTVVAAVYTIEFQKRGLPHAHICLFLHEKDKHTDPAYIDSIISAELPDKGKDPVGYEAVTQFMIHGPCGQMNPKSPCMCKIKKTCTKYYPRKFCSNTSISEDGYPEYRRRNNCRTTEKDGHTMDNRFVVPHNIDLYQANINVEWCNHYRSIKYLFKYMSKGPDMTLASIKETVGPNNDGVESDKPVDEIESFLRCRNVSASEASCRTFAFEIQFKKQPVQRLCFYLEREQEILFNDEDQPEEVLERVGEARTTLTEWMVTNQRYSEARELTYADFPTEWVWNNELKEWSSRKRGMAIGRIYFATPKSGEAYMLLNIVKGATIFADIRTFAGIVYPTFESACNARGLLEGDDEWHLALNEAATWSSAHKLRELFVTILLFCEVSDPKTLWESHWEQLSDDIVPRQRRRFGNRDLTLSVEQIKNYTLHEIEVILNYNNNTLRQFTDFPLPDNALTQTTDNRLILEELNYNEEHLAVEAEQLEFRMNNGQKVVYEKVIQAVRQKEGGVFFVYGSGGTGKTYLWKTIISRLRAEGKIVLAVASSGIAALLLSSGRTAHSRFVIPINLNEATSCRIDQGSDLAELIKQASLIIWDEAPMVHRHAFEAVDRAFRDITQVENPGAKDQVFGGKVVLLGGDFRQILSAVPQNGRTDIVDASISKSHKIWPYCTVLKLEEYMRIRQGVNEQEIAELTAFSKWVLDIGDGKILATAKEGEDEDAWINIPEDLLIENKEDPIASIVAEIYPDLINNYTNLTYLQGRAILAPKNDTTEEVNNYTLRLIPGEEFISRSVDRICPLTKGSGHMENTYPTEFLNTSKFQGLPNHELLLKVGCPIILRNLNQTAGLCNGTRLTVTKICTRILEAKIITGTNIGVTMSIPRIEMTPTDTKWPFTMKRRQFPAKVCFAMTINKSQGQTFENVGVYLPQPVFSHGQL